MPITSIRYGGTGIPPVEQVSVANGVKPIVWKTVCNFLFAGIPANVLRDTTPADNLRQ